MCKAKKTEAVKRDKRARQRKFKGKKRDLEDEESAARRSKRRKVDAKMMLYAYERREEKDKRRAKRREADRKRREVARSRRAEVLCSDCELPNRLAFQSAIVEYPKHVCMSCNKLCYFSVGTSVNEEKDSILLESMRGWGVSTPSCGWACKNKIVAGKLPPFCIANKMQAGVIPAELRILNPLEVRLVSRIHCFMKLHVLTFGQRAVSGGCINFPVTMAKVCAKLPRTPDDSGVILVHTGGMPGKPGGQWYSVSREYVVNALQWLVNNNVLYVDVIIENSCRGSVECSSNGDTDEPDIEMGVVRMDYTLPNIEVDVLVDKQNHHHVIHMGRIVAEPINLFTHPNAEEMGFPQLFPIGVNGFRAPREVKITALDYFQARLLSVDCHWQMNVAICFGHATH